MCIYIDRLATLRLMRQYHFICGPLVHHLPFHPGDLLFERILRTRPGPSWNELCKCTPLILHCFGFRTPNTQLPSDLEVKWVGTLEPTMIDFSDWNPGWSHIRCKQFFSRFTLFVGIVRDTWWPHKIKPNLRKNTWNLNPCWFKGEIDWRSWQQYILINLEARVLEWSWDQL